MSANTGYPNIHEAGDQRNYKQSELNDAQRYNEGKPNSHLQNDSSMSSPHTLLKSITNNSFRG